MFFPNCGRGCDGRDARDRTDGGLAGLFCPRRPECRPMTIHALRARLALAPPALFTAYATTAAFATYFCMYAFRKPFAAGTYEGSVALGALGTVDFKVLFIISQVFGYALSKFIGIKVVSELEHRHRALAILVCIGIAEIALVGFALLPTPYNALALVLNGLPLGMVWGLVFGFLEGRQTSDLLGAGLCASFIVASGFVKTVGLWLIALGVSEYWMPAVTGAVFSLPLLVAVLGLYTLPPPSPLDEEQRTRRKPMDSTERWQFFLSFAPGLIAITLMYAGLTAYRDLRDNYAKELWMALGWQEAPSILTAAELPVAFGSLVLVAALIFIRDNRYAVVAIHLMMALGGALIVGSTFAFQAGVLPPVAWMILVGLGLYLGYVPNNCIMFDRLLAAAKWTGTAGFLIYLVDAFGYLASVAALLYKNFGQPDLQWLEFFVAGSYVTGILCIALSGVSAAYFWRRLEPERVLERRS